eukprot:GHRR01000477.1.p2 GENE.GHRR01000477.1~~GHRR01000477.1.p2  ORF type:complete len:718 (+),score=-135.64 GHRR01000477.1:5231-7384(+)
MQTEREKKKIELIQLISQKLSLVDKNSVNIEREATLNNRFLIRDQKQRRTRQIKHRAWKKKKQNFAQKRRKLRKRRRSTTSKIRVFNKKLRRILSKREIQTWWWQTFFPSFQQTTEKTWRMQKNMQIRKELFELSEREILERDQSNSLQIGDKDYKPLAIPEAVRIRKELVQQQLLRFGTNETLKFKPETFIEKTIVKNPTKTEKSLTSNSLSSKEKQREENSEDVLRKLLYAFNEKSNALEVSSVQNTKFLVGINPIPFYTGWDESLRKFVVTNRLLSRKGCFSCSPMGIGLGVKGQTAASKIDRNKENIHFGSQDQPTRFEFSQAPLQGMNAATTLYWQIPFTTYDPDQFFALGMDGFSPIGWRNFSLKHSKQTIKPLLVKNFFSFFDIPRDSFMRFALYNATDSPHNFATPPGKNEIDKNFEYRRILKKQKRIKKHPRPPVWFPSGSLSQQVLPVHYIYVFYKRSRLPRDRYIRRRLRSNFTQTNKNQYSPENFTQNTIGTKITDFTLRKRAKPRRKYHRKRFVFENNQFALRRRKFRGFLDEINTNRPSSKLFQTSPKQEKRLLKSKQRQKITDSKQTNDTSSSTSNLRVRQLRRRVQRQVFRPIWRYRPRSGGFVWPGDYLRFELVKAPQLTPAPEFSPKTLETSTRDGFRQTQNKENLSFDTTQQLPRKIRKKKRRTIQEWQIQPKKYLLEKHNIKVLKKRYEKSAQKAKY